jgi:hypothetical protein
MVDGCSRVGAIWRMVLPLAGERGDPGGAGAGRRLLLGLADGRRLITSVPPAILYNFFLDHFIAGFTVGAIK